MSQPRLRFAPSPTGKLHIGGARTALFNWACARALQGAFLLRIEDTDTQRSRPEYEREILEGLAWLGIDWDEGPDKGGPCGPYRQSERQERYAARTQELLQAGHAYRCFCSEERLLQLREQRGQGSAPGYDRMCRSIAPGRARERAEAGEPYVVRFAVPEGTTRFRDHVRGEVVFQNEEVDDWIMVRSDHQPTYNFVVVCDDADMAITLVMRGEEHLVNTPKQVLLYQSLSIPCPEMAHLPLMLGKDGKKLSKRVGDTALADYRQNGYPPEALCNFLALQGWALDGERELFSQQELIANFRPGDVGRSGSVFDLDKLRWLAGEYIRADSSEHLAERCLPFVDSALSPAEDLRTRWDWFVAVVRSEQQRISTYAELPPRIAYLFAKDNEVAYSDQALAQLAKHPEHLEVLEAYTDWLAERPSEDAASLREASRAFTESRGLKFAALMQPLRLALTGLSGGPDLFEIMELLGREATLARLRHAPPRLRRAVDSQGQSLGPNPGRQGSQA